MEDKIISLNAAIDALVKRTHLDWEYLKIIYPFLDVFEQLPPTQPELYEDKLKEIASAISEKMCYMNTCPNERDIILGYLGRKRPSKNHCNTDCWNEKCESYHYETKQPEPYREEGNK